MRGKESDMSKIIKVSQDLNLGLSCPVCSQRILPGDIDECPEDEEFNESFTGPNYCSHVLYLNFGDEILYLNQEIKDQLANKGYEVFTDNYLYVKDKKGNLIDFFNAIDLGNLTEYRLASHLPFEEDSRIGFKID